MNVKNNTQIQKTRIVSFIKSKYPHLSQKQIKNIILLKKILINDRPARQHDWVDDGDLVSLDPICLKGKLQPNSHLDCHLIAKTKEYIFLNKGPFVHSVAHNWSEKETVANWLLSVDPKLEAVGKPLESGLVHRLDHETSGVMVAARNKPAFDWLKNLFQKRKVYKEYICFISSNPPAIGVHKAYAGKDPKSSKKILLQSAQCRNKKLREVEIKVLGSKKCGKSYEVWIQLMTGYRHQIRAQMALLGCPILGDRLYGGKVADRLMLHAVELRFEDRDGKERRGYSEIAQTLRLEALA